MITATQPPPNRALVLLARNPTAPRTGRIAVLESAVRGLQRADVEVTIVAMTSQDGPAEWMGARLERVAPQKAAGTGLAALRALAARRTLNSAVFDSKRIRDQVKAIARATHAQVVVADGLRSFGVASSLGLPVITHLDDLLSNRYSSSAFVEGNNSILGYYGKELPGPIRAGAERILSRLMGLEARRARVEEIHIAQHSAVSAMTSLEEARELSSRAGREVDFLPMGVDVALDAKPHEAPADTAVFVGALHYGPNMAALRFVKDEVLPILRQRGRAVRIDVIGKIGDNDISEFSDTVEFGFKDYAPDLAVALAGHRMLLSPVTAGTGVKTKALDGMSVSLPVVATTLGVAGVPVEPGVSALVADSAADYASAMMQLMDDPGLARDIGVAGRRILETSMTSAAVDDGWATAYRRAIGEEHR